MNNMIRHSSLFEANEKQKNIILSEKQKKQSLQTIRLQELDQECIKNDLKKAYFQKRVDLINFLINSDSEFIKKTMLKLKEENNAEKPNILAELALSNYKSHSNLNDGNKEEFIHNFQEGGTFQSYVLDKVGEMYPNELIRIKKEFIPQIKLIGIKESDLF